LSDLGLEDDPRLERRFRAFGPPAALLIALLLCAVARPFLRIFFGMWVHELGHAVTAWLCGFLAFPGPWLTPMSATRSLVFSWILAAALVSAAYARRPWRWFWVSLLALQVFCTVLLPLPRARELVIFMGDGGCLILGTALMMTMHAPPESAIRKGSLRWGFLAIGAAAFADVFSLWWGARKDPDLIPFGMNEGAGLSDPSVLSETYGWSAATLVHRYVGLGVVCLVVILAASALTLRGADDR
jgi:hypothetical protein